MVTSSAVVGSSAMRKSGSQHSIMAIRARWSIPPENSWGYWSIRFSGLAMPTFCSISSALARAELFVAPGSWRRTISESWFPMV